MSTKPIQVVCLNWHDYLGRGSEYVEKMRNMVSRNLSHPHTFTEVTERDLPTGREGWFNKLYLLEMFDGPVLYIDLDVVITGNIDALVDAGMSLPEMIWARDDWSYSVLKGDNGREKTINSSVMFWHGRKDMRGAERLISKTHGDQGIITQLFWPDYIGLFPGHLIKSYKYDYLQGAGRSPICVFHGKPKPHEVSEGWVIEHWR
jgi:hypothetical protein